MSKGYKRNCNQCGEYYEGQGINFCSKKCFGKNHRGKNHHNWMGISGFKKGNKANWKGGLPNCKCGKKLGDSRAKQCKECFYKSDSFKKHLLILGGIGEKNPNWKGGLTKIQERIRKSVKYKIWRNTIFKIDDYTCQLCKQVGGKLCVDHIVPFSYILKTLKIWIDEFQLDIYKSVFKFEPLWDINNGRTLCISCHKQTETYGEKALKYNFFYAK